MARPRHSYRPFSAYGGGMFKNPDGIPTDSTPSAPAAAASLDGLAAEALLTQIEHSCVRGGSSQQEEAMDVASAT